MAENGPASFLKYLADFMKKKIENNVEEFCSNIITNQPIPLLMVMATPLAAIPALRAALGFGHEVQGWVTCHQSSARVSWIGGDCVATWTFVCESPSFSPPPPLHSRNPPPRRRRRLHDPLARR